MEIHVAHLRRVLGDGLIVAAINTTDLQRFDDARALAAGRRGRTLSAATIKEELVTLRTAWNWARHVGVLKTAFPLKGVTFPKTQEKPPFQTWAEIERQIKHGGLSDAEEAELLDSLFLTVPEIAELPAYVRGHATKPFVYPMVVFAAHTGARRSEMLRSKIRDVDFESGKITIREKKRDHSRSTTRRVPMSPVLRRVLNAWLHEHPGGPSLFCDRLAANDSAAPPRSRTMSCMTTSGGRLPGASGRRCADGTAYVTASRRTVPQKGLTSGSSTRGWGTPAAAQKSNAATDI